MDACKATEIYTLRLADNALILAQRLTELVAHGPELEEELANANIALDFLGQARMFYQYAGELEGAGRSEDDFAFLRDSREFRNLLLVEQPNGHFGDVVARQVLFETFYAGQLGGLVGCNDARLAEIAARAVKEVRYHLRHMDQWLVRLGDGTDESHERVQGSVNRLWRYTGEMFAGDEIDAFVRDELNGPDLETVHAAWRARLEVLFAAATLALPEDGWMASGGRQGIHTEHLGYLVAEMQHLRRAYPGAEW